MPRKIANVHTLFFSPENKEHVSLRVAANADQQYGIQLDASFGRDMLNVMSQVYTNNPVNQGTDPKQHLNYINDIVISECMKIVNKMHQQSQFGNDEVPDLARLAEREASSRGYNMQEPKAPPVRPNFADDVSKINREINSKYDTDHNDAIPMVAESIQQESSVVGEPATNSNSISNEAEHRSSPVMRKRTTITTTIDFRKDLIDIEDGVYCLKVPKMEKVVGISIKAFMIEQVDTVVKEPYVYIDLPDVDDGVKNLMLHNNKFVLGRMIQGDTIANGRLTRFSPENCSCGWIQPVSMNHIKVSIIDYSDTNIHMNSLPLRKIQTKNTKNLIFQTKSNHNVSPDENITIVQQQHDKNKNMVITTAECTPVVDIPTKNSLSVEQFDISKNISIEKNCLNCNLTVDFHLAN